MKAVIQRVSNASLSIGNELHNRIKLGFVILLGIHELDTITDAKWLSQKVANLRIFSDTEGKMNLNIMDVKGEILLISQFTLYSLTKKGNRPSFIQAARPEKAIPLYELFQKEIEALNIPIKTGIFGADMKVQLENDGPVTIIIDTLEKA
jgi:D-tyrosyl-tRNA(Tyr) deacylase